MRRIFVDSSAWYALADEGDVRHAAAARQMRRLVADRRGLIITNHIAAETYTLLRVCLGPLAAHSFLHRVRQSGLAQRVFVPESWEEAAEELLVQYGDQDFSYVDATSFVAMRRLGLREAFTFDHHFAILGFTIITN